MDRRQFIRLGVDKKKKILEIGPSRNPMYPKREGYLTHIVDHESKEGLQKKYEGMPGVDKIEDVDFVCSSTYARAVGKTSYYDVVAASHVIEHVSDFVGTLQDFSRLLTTEGKVKLIVPDKRYEMDYFREVSSIGNIISTHLEKNGSGGAFNTIGHITDALMNTGYVKGLGTHFPNAGFLYRDAFELGDKDKTIYKLVKLMQDGGREDFYGHVWTFTPQSFSILIYQLNILGLIDLYMDSLWIEENSIEFYVILKKGQLTYQQEEMKALYLKRKMEEIEAIEGWYTIQRMQEEKKCILIYGTGEYSQIVTRQLEILGIELEGYIVSDGYRTSEEVDGKHVYELSELNHVDDVMVLLGVGNGYRNEVKNNLEQKGISYHSI